MASIASILSGLISRACKTSWSGNLCLLTAPHAAFRTCVVIRDGRWAGWRASLHDK